jgi:hypothetical protein
MAPGGQLMNPEFLATLGIGGVLAGFMFVFYRKDMKQYTDQWRTVTDQLIGVIKENTASNSKLITLIESQERNSLRKTDIEALIAKRSS